MLHSILIGAALIAAPQTATSLTATATTTGTAVRTAPTATIAPERRVCVRTERAGSFLTSKTCRSYARWLADGVDPMQGRRVR